MHIGRAWRPLATESANGAAHEWLRASGLRLVLAYLNVPYVALDLLSYWIPQALAVAIVIFLSEGRASL
jgi:hypothetical protein